MSGQELSDEAVDNALALSMVGYIPGNWDDPEWSNRSVREAYRLGWGDHATASQDTA